jgi:hypothetical protein
MTDLKLIEKKLINSWKLSEKAIKIIENKKCGKKISNEQVSIF